jgi:UDP-N-acetylglucosamine--N-acetylmuramyl-(pentapeptide) pyrophosphoryl-undecaprenol N-acetylglucosamine transferase
VGQAGGMEAKIVAASGWPFAAIKAGKFRRNHFAGSLAKVFNVGTLGPNARDAVRTVQGVAGALRVLRRFKPDVVFIKGGFVGVPVGLAAKLLRIPYVIHESDVTPGLANRLLGRWAEKIAVGFPPKHYRDFDAARLVFTGNPVRQELLQADRQQALAYFELDEALPVLFVTGGSGGAMQINDAIIRALPRLVEFCQVIHLTGEQDFSRVKFEVGRLGKVVHVERYHVFGFLMAEMAQALAVADVVLARAGANTIAELAVLGKPTVLIPNYQMAGHQVENARVLSRAGAVRVLDGAKLTVEQLVGEVKRLLDDPEEQGRLVRALAQFGRKDAARELAEVILAVGRVGDRGVEQKPNKRANAEVSNAGEESRAGEADGGEE